MPLETLLINGPSGGGKSTLAELVADRVLDRPPHWLRVEPARDQHTNVIVPIEPGDPEHPGDRWASAHLVYYTPERVFETLPEALRTVRRIERFGFTMIEAGTDASLRHAYPYDYRVFVMPPPADVNQVFRQPHEAAQALQQVMQDTAAFASEIFGLFDSSLVEDGVGVHHEPHLSVDAGRERMEQLEVGEDQIRSFFNSPLGGEIASRIQLTPDFHAVVESDVVVINTGIHGSTDNLNDCVQRLEKLLARIRHDARQHSILYWGALKNGSAKPQQKLVDRLKNLFVKHP
jgi:hypothetical protein